MWVGIRGEQAGEADKGTATLRVQNGKVVSFFKENIDVLIEHYCTYK